MTKRQPRRITPIAVDTEAVKFLCMSEVLSNWPRREAAVAMAWWNRREYPFFERQMCSEWNRGNLCLKDDDWKPDRKVRRVKDADPRESIVEDMVICDSEYLAKVRGAFDEMRNQPRPVPAHRIHDAKQLAAFRAAFDEVARHVATGRREAFYAPAGAQEEGAEVWGPGTDPLHCRVVGCGGLAFLYRARRGEAFIEEAVCTRDPKHRGPTVRKHEVLEATKQSILYCTYCGAPGVVRVRTFRQDSVIGQLYKCNSCGDAIILPVEPNLPLQMQWREEGRFDASRRAGWMRNGWPDPGPLVTTKQLPREVDGVEYELARIDALIAARPPITLRGLRGTPPSQDILRLRMRILEDAELGIADVPGYYVQWAQEYLGWTYRRGWAVVGYAFTFFREKGVKVAEKLDRSVQGYRDFITRLMDDDLAAGRLRTPGEYQNLLAVKFPKYVGKGPKVLVWRELDLRKRRAALRR